MTDGHQGTTWFEEFSVGDVAPEYVARDVGLHEFVRYAGASGDFNPIHYDEEYAEAAGNETIFGQGMFTAGILSHAVCEWVGRAGLREFTTRFNDRVSPGDDLHVRCEIVAMDESTATVEGETEVENQNGVVVITGSFRAALPRRSDHDA